MHRAAELRSLAVVNHGRRLWLMAGASLVLALGAPACGSDGRSAGTLPPISTTSSTSSTISAPTTTIQTYYKIKRGDTLRRIARSFGVSLDQLKQLNGIVDENKIQAGETLQIPPATLVVDSLPVPPTTPPPLVGLPTTAA